MLYEQLTQHFGREKVFKDIDTIPYGVDFVEEVERAVKKCDVLIAVIGRFWLNAKSETGKRRIDSLNDFVRVEIETALKRNIADVAVPLLNGAYFDGVILEVDGQEVYIEHP